MAITREEVLHVAKLARLELTDDEVERLTLELGAILEAVGKVAELDLDDVPPTSHPLSLANAWRDDEPHESLGARRGVRERAAARGRFLSRSADDMRQAQLTHTRHRSGSPASGPFLRRCSQGGRAPPLGGMGVSPRFGLATRGGDRAHERRHRHPAPDRRGGDRAARAPRAHRRRAPPRLPRRRRRARRRSCTATCASSRSRWERESRSRSRT